jgi:hypothetical protein
MAQRPVRAPFLGKLHSRAVQVALKLLQLPLKPGKESEGIRGCAGKSHKDAITVNAPDLPSALLDNRVAERYLPVPGNHDPVASSDQKNGRSMKDPIF